VENVAEINVHITVKQILAKSSILKEMVENGEIGIIGAMYDVAKGEVAFYDDSLHLQKSKEAAMAV
jgi:carbonic anhydrase